MKQLLLALFLFSSFYAKPCGWDPDEDYYFFYNVFEQKTIEDKGFYPFLRNTSGIFYENDYENPIDGNVALWTELLPEWDKADIQTAFKDNFKNPKNLPISTDVASYIAFAQECGELFNYKSEYYWGYEDIRNKKAVDISELLEPSIETFKATKNKNIKLRYGYQIVRMLHYTKQYEAAIAFFNKHIEGKFNTNEMYYYTLDQVAGCYYKQGKYADAAYKYLTVFNKSNDRKKSAYLSFMFCSSKNVDIKQFVKTNDEKIAHLTLIGLTSFANPLQVFDEAIAIDPSNKKLELLFMRALNDLESEVWETSPGLNEVSFPKITDKSAATILKLKSVAQQMQKNKAVKNKDYWLLAESYCSFLEFDFNTANKLIGKVKSEHLAYEKKNLMYVYEVFSWDKMDSKKEAYIAPVLDEIIKPQSIYIYSELRPAWKYSILEHIGHIYYKDKKYAKAYLMHNSIYGATAVSNEQVLKDLVAFCSKTDYNYFEKLLLRRVHSGKEKYSPKDYAEYAYGIYLLETFKIEEAYELLKDSPLEDGLSTAIANKIDKYIFSNNTLEGFDYNMDYIMTDDRYSTFNFIPQEFSKSKLAEILIKLHAIVKDPEVDNYDKKAAMYALGNYYYNISGTGLYRGYINGDTYLNFHSYFPSNKKTCADTKIKNNIGYNLGGAEYAEKRYYGYATKALEYYSVALKIEGEKRESEDHTYNKEWNARTLYMMAKCELNLLYNSDVDAWGMEVNESTFPYKQSFKKLHDNYSDTDFYTQIIRECSYFAVYVASI